MEDTQTRLSAQYVCGWIMMCGAIAAGLNDLVQNAVYGWSISFSMAVGCASCAVFVIIIPISVGSNGLRFIHALLFPPVFAIGVIVAWLAYGTGDASVNLAAKLAKGDYELAEAGIERAKIDIRDNADFGDMTILVKDAENKLKAQTHNCGSDDRRAEYQDCQDAKAAWKLAADKLRQTKTREQGKLDLDKWTAKLAEVGGKVGAKKIEAHKGVEMASAYLGLKPTELEAWISQGISGCLIWVSVIAPFMAGVAAEMIKNGRQPSGLQVIVPKPQDRPKLPRIAPEAELVSQSSDNDPVQIYGHSVQVWLEEATEPAYRGRLFGGESRQLFERWYQKLHPDAKIRKEDFMTVLISIYGKERVKGATSGFTVSGVALKSARAKKGKSQDAAIVMN